MLAREHRIFSYNRLNNGVDHAIAILLIGCSDYQFSNLSVLRAERLSKST